MIRVLRSLDRKTEAWLYRSGFANPGVRGLVKCQLYVALTSSALAFLLGLRLGGAFAAGALLMTVNFFFLGRVVQEFVFVRKGAAVASLLFGFYLRLFLTGAALFLLIAWVEAPVVALLAGLTTVVVAIFMWSVFIRGKT
jgi:hypothetical protein